MRRKKPMVLISIIFILSLTVIFSNAEQDKRRRITNSSQRDIYSLKNNILKDKIFGPRNNQLRPLKNRILKNKFFGPRNIQPLYSLPKIDNKPRYAPGEIVIKFKLPLSDFDADYLIGDYLYKRFGRLDSNLAISRRIGNNHYLIGLPENCSVEQMIKILERNPYVEYAEPNFIAHITEIPNEHGDYFPKKLHPIRSKAIAEVRGEGLLMDIEPAPRADSARQFLEALKKKDMLHKDIHGETNLVPAAYNAGQEEIKKYSGIPPYPETDNYLRKIQSSDKKPIIRSKAKIYKFRDSKGRLVITNDYLYNSNANKK